MEHGDTCRHYPSTYWSIVATLKYWRQLMLVVEQLLHLPFHGYLTPAVAERGATVSIHTVGIRSISFL